MKCLSCNVVLSDDESVLKFEHGGHIDLCFNCLETTEILVYQDNLAEQLNESVHHEII
jgi:hypothetical protein